MITKYRFSSIDADYHQFHLQDANAANGSLGDAWTAEAQARDVAVAPLIVGIGTRRDTSVWLDLEVHDVRPDLKLTRNLMRVVECSLELPSGKLVITSPTQPLEYSDSILLAPNVYRLRVHFGKISQRGVHRYKVSLWQEVFAPVKVIKPKRRTSAKV